MPPPIPDRWIPYLACGKVIVGTRIICFKVPLKKAVQVGKPDIKEIWDIPMLLKKIPKLGAVIDLTNTARYYDPRELQAAGVLHKKILIPGRTIPPEEKVKEFMDTVDEFLGKDCELLVGVHCTHGLNRTGYMVCRYMRDRLNIPAKKAIKSFEKARGYKIERENYIADLMGQKPPPPDIGNYTELKPLHRDSKMPRRNRYDDDDDSCSNSANYGSDRKYARSDRRNRDSDRSNYNVRTEGRDREASSRHRTLSESSYTYDYRHDY